MREPKDGKNNNKLPKPKSCHIARFVRVLNRKPLKKKKRVDINKKKMVKYKKLCFSTVGLCVAWTLSEKWRFHVV